MTVQYAAELFSGGGGLAVGLRRGGVVPVAAVELDAYAATTFSANHPNVALFQRDIREVAGRDLLAESPSGMIDILAACPPCQGFSTLTSKYKRDDHRNSLVKEVGRIAKETLPLAIMMENVPGLAGRGLPLLQELISELQELGYIVNYSILQVADYGVPQTRRRLVLLAGLGFRIEMPRPTHAKDARKDLAPWRCLQDAISTNTNVHPIDQAIARGGFAAVNWHVTRRLGAANLERLRVAEPGRSRRFLPAEIRPTCHRDDASGFRNTYGRMSWDKPSPTITAGCLSPSKGRFGHPDELRTLSLREAALLQTFPADYKFVGDRIDRACAVVGNALPCVFAEVIAARVRETIARVEAWLPDGALARRRRLIP